MLTSRRILSGLAAIMENVYVLVQWMDVVKVRGEECNEVCSVRRGLGDREMIYS
jgi:hypothetical protein